MVLHILEHLLDERAHALHLFVLFRLEVNFVLIVHSICVVFLTHRLHTSICSQKLLFFRLIRFLIDIFAETKFVKFWSSVITLEVVINVYEGEVRHSRPIYGLSILKPTCLRESCFPTNIKYSQVICQYLLKYTYLVV